MKHLISCCFPQNITKQVNSLIHLTSYYGNLYGNCNRYQSNGMDILITMKKVAIFIATNLKTQYYGISLLLKNIKAIGRHYQRR